MDGGLQLQSTHTASDGTCKMLFKLKVHLKIQTRITSPLLCHHFYQPNQSLSPGSSLPFLAPESPHPHLSPPIPCLYIPNLPYCSACFSHSQPLCSILCSCATLHPTIRSSCTPNAWAAFVGVERIQHQPATAHTNASSYRVSHAVFAQSQLVAGSIITLAGNTPHT